MTKLPRRHGGLDTFADVQHVSGGSELHSSAVDGSEHAPLGLRPSLRLVNADAMNAARVSPPSQRAE